MRQIRDIVVALAVIVLAIILAPFEIIYAGTVSREKRSKWNYEANRMSGMED